MAVCVVESEGREDTVAVRDGCVERDELGERESDAELDGERVDDSDPVMLLLREGVLEAALEREDVRLVETLPLTLGLPEAERDARLDALADTDAVLFAVPEAEAVVSAVTVTDTVVVAVLEPMGEFETDAVSECDADAVREGASLTDAPPVLLVVILGEAVVFPVSDDVALPHPLREVMAERVGEMEDVSLTLPDSLDVGEMLERAERVWSLEALAQEEDRALTDGAPDEEGTSEGDAEAENEVLSEEEPVEEDSALIEGDGEWVGLAEELRDTIALVVARSEAELLGVVIIDAVVLLETEGDGVVEVDGVGCAETMEVREAAALFEEEREALSVEEDVKEVDVVRDRDAHALVEEERDVDRVAETEGVVDADDCKEGVLMLDNVPEMAVGEALEELVGVGASDAVGEALDELVGVGASDAVGEALEELVGVGASDAVETPEEVGFGVIDELPQELVLGVMISEASAEGEFETDGVKELVALADGEAL